MSIKTDQGLVTDIFVNHEGTKKAVKSGWCNYNGIVSKFFEKGGSSIFNFNWYGSGTYVTGTGLCRNWIYLNPSELKSIKINGQLRGRKTGTSGVSGYNYLYLCATKIGSTNEENIKILGSVNITSTSQVTTTLTDVLIDLENDIDWTVYDKTKPIILKYDVVSIYRYIYLSLSFEVETNQNYININPYIIGGSSSNLSFSRINLLNPKLIKSIYASGTVSSTNRSSYVYQQAFVIGETSYTNISTIAEVLAGSSVNVDLKLPSVDWEIYDAEIGVSIYHYPVANTTSPGIIDGNINYKISL